ncbi:XrtN system VIT domain-containing protein [Spirosoma gilvum]
MNIKSLRTSLTSRIRESENQSEITGYDFPISARSRFLEPFQDPFFGIGLGFLAASGSAFLLYELLSDPRQNDNYNGAMILLHYSLTVIFSVILWTHGYFKPRTDHYAKSRPTRWLGLLLWLISAYALNREIPVFQQSTAWLCWVLVITGAAMLLFAWKDSLPVRAQQALYAILAIGWWLFVYMAFYMVLLYHISIPMLIGLGLSFHSYVPLLFAIALGKRLWFDGQQDEHLRLGIGFGLMIPVITVGLFVSSWIHDLNRIEQTQLEATVRKTSDLPDWVLVAQRLKPGWVTNRVLVNNRVYDRMFVGTGNGVGFGGFTKLDEVREHDPLVAIASQLFPADVLDNANQLALLKVVSANRHGAEEKLWTGHHLTTEDVVSQVRIWPQFRISYTEQTFRIRNHARSTTEEALFTFHLPAGSVVSSMSLWVNGREEPARLTTVAKADTAYRTIVGVDSRRVARDPSVVHWQEGNRVTVRVFPCRAGEDRRVKIGITSPLRQSGNQLMYQAPTAEGPDASSASELIHIDFASAPIDLQTPWLLNLLQANTLTHQGNYNPGWALRFQAPALSPEAFVLNDKGYQVTAHQQTTESFTPTDVFLDVNENWEKDEFTTAYWTAAKQRNCRVWVFDDGLKQLTASNLDDTYDRLHQQSFSLFPIYRISNPATALLITKSASTGPVLSDLQNSQFADRFGELANPQAPLRTFCLASQNRESSLSPFLKTLAELGVLNVLDGTTDDLATFYTSHQFPRFATDSARISLPEAGIDIQAVSSSVAKASTAPDHLARLFGYNQLVRHIGRKYFVKNYQTDSLLQEAQQAHIVSPLSSLVVLETTADYDRFGIKKDKSGLDNATLKEDGAVPEPHEWALFGLLALSIGWLIWRKHYALH